METSRGRFAGIDVSFDRVNMTTRQEIMRTFLLLPLAVWTLALAGGPSNTADIARKAIPAVVLIKGTTAAGSEITGSGFIVDATGTIVTNLHVIQDLKAGGVRLANGDIYDRFTIRAFDERKDLAVIQIAGFDLPRLDLGNSDGLSPGDQVLVVG